MIKIAHMAADVLARAWAATIALAFAWVLFSAPHGTVIRVFFGSFIAATVYSAMFRPIPYPPRSDA